MKNQNSSFFERISQWFQQSLSIKLASIGGIMLLLMIPNTMVRELIHEREYLQRNVINEVGAKWGKAQTLVDAKGEEKITEISKTAYFLPENLKINGELIPEIRKRSLYKVNLYKANLQIEGNFGALGFDFLSLQSEQFEFDKAKIIFGIPDMAGIEDNIFLQWGEQNLRMQPGVAQSQILNSGVSVPVDLTGTEKNIPFGLDLKLRGSQTIHFAPIGKETIAELNSSWQTPSFEGNFLPSQHKITEAGFSANWKVLDFNRNYPQQWIGNDNHFMVFFFFEIINGLNIHAIQYIFIGLAISIFYILLLSLSEHIGFNAAYWVSTLAIIGLIVPYSSAILKDKKRTGILAAIIGAIYTFIFIILQLEDYALLAGSIGLFAVLAIAMILSRKIDWHTLKRSV